MPFYSEDLTSLRDNPTQSIARSHDRISLDQWLFHGAMLSIDIVCDPCWHAFRRQCRRAQPICPGFEPADADHGCFAYVVFVILPIANQTRRKTTTLISTPRPRNC